MAALKFKSLRQKLMHRIIQILCMAFFVILSSVIWFNYSSSIKNLDLAEESIRLSIVAKGRILVANNSRALIGMVEDNAFSAVQDLVSSTVEEDEEIVYGIFMDQNRQAWVAHYSEYTSTSHQTGDSFHDDVSVWADQLETTDSRFVENQGMQMYEFASPVSSEDIKVGTIRYGITTKYMRESLTDVQQRSRETIIYTLSSLILIASLVFIASYWIIRRFAIAITKPLASLTHSAEIISEGDYATKIDIESNDEIGLLSENFDRMRNTISKKITDLFEINTASDAFAIQYSKDALIKKAFQSFSRHFNIISGVIYSKAPDGVVHADSVYKNTESTHLIYVSDDVLDVEQGPIKECIASPDIIVSGNLKEDRRFNGLGYSYKQQFAMIFVPILEKDQVVGAVLLFCEGENFSFEEGDYAYTKAVARSFAINMKNISMREVITEQNLNLERKVEQRTESLKEKTNDIVNMMKNLNQGLFTILPDGKVHSEYSSYLRVLLETDQISGELFSDLLFSDCDIEYDQVRQIESAVNAVIGDEEMTFVLNKHILISEYLRTKKDGSICYVELDWNPIIVDDVIEKIMVTVRDVTKVKTLQAQAEEKERELVAVGHLLHIGKEPCFQFVASSQNVLISVQKALGPTSVPTAEALHDVLRSLHTLKGNSRTLSFTSISNSIHNAESLLAKVEGFSGDDGSKWLTLKIELRDILSQVSDEIDYYSRVAEEKLNWEKSSLNTADNTLVLSSYNQLMSKSSTAYNELNKSNMSKESKDVLIQVARISQRICAPSLIDIIKPLKNSLSSLSEELSKPSPIVELDIDDIHIKQTYCEKLSTVFLHILRNSLDHGIESESERIENNKFKAGKISIAGRFFGNSLSISIQDDGRGMALDNIKKHQVFNQGKDGVDVSDQDLANSIFCAGVSTSENITEISGRGIGMDVVKHMLREIGANIQIHFTSEKVDGYRQFSTEIILPQSVYEKSIMSDVA